MTKRRRKKLRGKRPQSHNAGLPRGAIRANPSLQAPNNSYSPPDYYIDIEFKCRDCGKRQVWLAKDQQWYYEVVKGSIYATAVRCRDCRKRRREMIRNSQSG